MSGFTINPLALDELLHTPGGPVGKKLELIARQVEAEAKRICPVGSGLEDTPGLLKDSITHTTTVVNGELVAHVGSNAPYAVHVEYGTGIMPAEPFLRPALYGTKV